MARIRGHWLYSEDEVAGQGELTDDDRHGKVWCRYKRCRPLKGQLRLQYRSHGCNGTVDPCLASVLTDVDGCTWFTHILFIREGVPVPLPSIPCAAVVASGRQPMSPAKLCKTSGSDA
jgi:hypothetical protein